MKEKNLCEVLKKCSKAELIEIIIKAKGLAFATSWMEIINEARLDEIESRIDANLAEGKELTHKFSEMAKNSHNYTYDEIMEIRVAIAKNHEEWKRLDRKYVKISKELYG